MKIIAFDIARNTGIAIGETGGDPKAWSINLGATHDQRFAKALQITSKLIRAHKPDLIVIEDVVGRAKTPHVNVMIIGCVRGVAHDRKVPVKMYDVAEIRKHFLGRNVTKRDFPNMTQNQSRKAIKALVIKRCQLLNWDVKNDDQADACAIWDYAASLHRSHQSAPLGGLFNGSK